MSKDISKLPKWAQRVIKELRQEAIRANTKLNEIEKAHSVLLEKEWMTVNHDQAFENTWAKSMRLFTLHLDHAQPVCSIGRGDILLIGRAKKEAE
jgi:sugar phosphate isomerase/epimerase